MLMRGEQKKNQRAPKKEQRDKSREILVFVSHAVRSSMQFTQITRDGGGK